MKRIKDELQYIICGDGQVSTGGQLKKTQTFLRGYAETNSRSEKRQHIESQETKALLTFAHNEDLFYSHSILERDFLGEGAEQKIYRLDDDHILKTNECIFYENWLDYFNSLLIHTFFFPTTAYTFLGFIKIDDSLHAVVKQKFVLANEPTNLEIVKNYLQRNGFSHKRNNDYFIADMGLILEDLHDENVLSYNGVLAFVDTIFYLTPTFYI